MFKPLLSATVDLKKLKFPVLASPKFDGIRCIMYNGKAVSRTLKPIANHYIREQLEKLGNCSFDGELVVGLPTNPNCMQETSSGVMSFNSQPDFTYYVFDCVNLHPFNLRLRIAQVVIEGLPSTNNFTKFVNHKYIHNIEELLAYEEEKVSEGYEGIMIRSPGGIYKEGRSTVNEGILLKMKRFFDEEATVIGFEERLHNANDAEIDARGYTKRSSLQENMIPTDTLGTLIVHSTLWGEFNVGSGFTDVERQEIWDNQEKYLNKRITFKYQPHGVKDKPRVPIFKCFRENL